MGKIIKKIRVKDDSPIRNPFATPARFRKAGRHVDKRAESRRKGCRGKIEE